MRETVGPEPSAGADEFRWEKDGRRNTVLFQNGKGVLIKVMPAVIERQDAEWLFSWIIQLKVFRQSRDRCTGPCNAERALRKAKLAREVRELDDIITDVPLEVNNAIDSGKRVLIEGTQGTYLSLFHGTYPYVTSKDVTASAACSDVGVGPAKIDDVIVVFKAFTTRVGAGPLPNEISPAEAEKRGWTEYGTVTGRPRRASPFNFELAKRAVMLNGGTHAAVTKVDVLFPECKGATSYSRLSKDAKAFILPLFGLFGLAFLRQTKHAAETT